MFKQQKPSNKGLTDSTSCKFKDLSLSHAQYPTGYFLKTKLPIKELLPLFKECTVYYPEAMLELPPKLDKHLTTILKDNLHLIAKLPPRLDNEATYTACLSQFPKAIVYIPASKRTMSLLMQVVASDPMGLALINLELSDKYSLVATGKQFQTLELIRLALKHFTGITIELVATEIWDRAITPDVFKAYLNSNNATTGVEL